MKSKIREHLGFKKQKVSKRILLSVVLIVLCSFANAQMHDRFYSNGNSVNVRALGAYGAVTYINWKDIQPTPVSTYTWTFTDSLITQYINRGIHPMITVSCTHPYTNAYTITSTCDYSSTVSGGDNKSNWLVVGSDTTLWKNFITALVERYDMDGNNDIPMALAFPVTEWHIIGQEWDRVWCDAGFSDMNLQYAQDFVKLEKMTYNTIKAAQPTSTVSYAGMDIRFQSMAFYDGYLSASVTTLCVNSNSCTNTATLTQSSVSVAPKFLPSRRNVMHIFKNALADEVDIHQYGRYQFTKDFVRWAKDSTFGKPITFMEGGGPFCPACENIGHPGTDMDGKLPVSLVRDNASYVVYHVMTAFESDVKKIHWNLPTEYPAWGAPFGDIDLMSLGNKRKPSFHVYRFLSQTVFSNPNADAVVRVTESNPALYHYSITPLGLNAVWSTNANDNIVVNGTGQLYMWNIPTTCVGTTSNSVCDSIIQQTSVSVAGNYTINLINSVPVFYSWGNVISVPENSAFLENFSLQVFPNPFNGQTVLYTNKYLSEASISLVNTFGQEVKQINGVSGQSTTIECATMPPGVYFVRVMQNGKLLATKKIILIN